MMDGMMKKVMFLHGLESKPWGSKSLFLKEIGHEVVCPALIKNDFEESVRIARDCLKKEKPDVVVGSSRGGAVALHLDIDEERLVLIAPAWKRFGCSYNPPKVSGVILHSSDDDVIPYSDSEELAKLGGYALFDIGE